MADIVRAQGISIPLEMQTRYRDMGDGTHALVTWAEINEMRIGVPHEYTVTIALINTEYVLGLPILLRQLEFQARESVDVRWAFSTGHVAVPTDPYRTLKAGAYYYSAIMTAEQPLLLFLAADKPDTHVEILAWT